MASTSPLDIKSIGNMARAGYTFAPTQLGMTRSNETGWPELATTDISTIKGWLGQRKSLVSVAKHGHQYILDIDDPIAAVAAGFKMEWLDGLYIVDTPSGGIHASGLHDAVSNAIPYKWINVRAVKNDFKSKLIVELKLDSCSTAAPSAPRFGQRNKVDGIYEPRVPFTGTSTGIHPDLLNWFYSHMDDKPVTMPGRFKGFHPDFDLDEFLANETCTLFDEGEVDGAWHAVVDECPHCGKHAVVSTLRAGITKFIFGGHGVGFICHACSIGTMAEHTAEMHNTWDNHEEWDWNKQYIYKMDDPKEQAAKWGGVPIDIGDEVDEPASTVGPEPVVEDEAADPLEPKEPNTGILTLNVEENDDWTREFKVRTADSIPMEELRWLWPQKFPFGKLGLVNGKPDSGKSTFLIDLVARISTGREWPDGAANEHGARRVLYCSSEDDPSDTIVPRLVAAGANLSKVLFPERLSLTLKEGGKTTKEHLSVKKHIVALYHTCKANPDIAAIVLDPFVSYLGDTNIMKEEEVKPVMDSLAELGRKTGVAIIYLVHSSKRSDVDAMGKVMGAQSLSGSARVAWTFAKDTEDDTLYRMGVIKGNIIRKKTGLEYKIVGVDVVINGKKSSQACIQWGAESTQTADDILRSDREKARGGGEDTKKSIAMAILRDTVPGFAHAVFKKAEDEGIDKNAIWRAKDVLKIQSKKEGRLAFWYFPNEKGDPEFDRAQAKVMADAEPTMDTIEMIEVLQ